MENKRDIAGRCGSTGCNFLVVIILLALMLSVVLVPSVYASCSYGFAAGYVTNSLTGEPVVGATVEISSQYAFTSTTTVEAGYYSKKHLDCGTITVVAFKLGYLAADPQTNVIENHGDTARTDFVLTPVPVTLSVATEGSGRGRITSDPSGIDTDAGEFSKVYIAETTVSLTATPDSNSVFSGWTGSADCADGSVMLLSDMLCSAIFKAKPPMYVVGKVQIGGVDNIYLRTSADGGETWSSPIMVSDNVGNSGSPTVAADWDRVYVFWENDSTGNKEIYMRSSTDQGETWSVPVRITNEQGNSRHPGISVSVTGLDLVWEYVEGGNRDIKLMRSTDHGVTWSTPVTLSSGPLSVQQPAITITSE